MFGPVSWHDAICCSICRDGLYERSYYRSPATPDVVSIISVSLDGKLLCLSKISCFPTNDHVEQFLSCHSTRQWFFSSFSLLAPPSPPRLLPNNFFSPENRWTFPHRLEPFCRKRAMATFLPSSCDRFFFPIPFRHQTDVKCFAAIINSFETHEAIRQQRREGAEEKS